MRSSAATAALLLSYALLPSSSANPSQQAVFSADSASSHPITTQRKPFGRFLHVTDLHPDPHYKHGSAVYGACHHKKPKKKKAEGKQRAGWWGTALSDCDSPPRLVESSLAWASNNLLENNSSEPLGLDFVIWTGDSARHDNDDKLPRTSKEIFDLNRWTLQQLEAAFPGVPLVPTVGNNDIFPHNILFPGPNAVTKEYVSIWQDHIPEYEFHTFEQGGYFVKEILPNRLAAMSLNTLYFYDNNKAVDGCVSSKKKDHSGRDLDPGTAQLDWLEVQLKLFRERGMQVHLLGHVPPTAGNYFQRCYKRYTDIVLRFQDTIVAQHFGHMNTDAFFVQEDQEAVASTESAHAEDDLEEEEETAKEVPVHVEEEGLPGDLRKDFSTLPGKGRTNQDFYSVFFIAPSIIPTYYPSIRLWTYNTTEEARFTAATAPSSSPFEPVSDDVEESEEGDENLVGEDEDDQEDTEIDPLSRHHHRPDPPKKRKGRKHKKKRRHSLPRHASPHSPSRTNTYLSLLGYSQWVMDIEEQNAAIEKILHPDSHHNGLDKDDKDKKGKKDKKKKHDNDDDSEEEKRRRKEAEEAVVSFRLEYATYPSSVLWQEFDDDTLADGVKSKGPVPVPKALLETELKRAGLKHPFDTSSSTDDVEVDKKKGGKKGKKLAKPLRKFTDYSLPAVTVGEMMDLARKLMVDKKLWKRFVDRIYSESGYQP